MRAQADIGARSRNIAGGARPFGGGGCMIVYHRYMEMFFDGVEVPTPPPRPPPLRRPDCKIVIHTYMANILYSVQVRKEYRIA